MTDLEMTKLCAEAMGYTDEIMYDPLHDDAQAMALAKKFYLHIDQRPKQDCSVQDYAFTIIVQRKDCDLNRAICECVSKMQKDKP